jgi:hypothetical protein
MAIFPRLLLALSCLDVRNLFNYISRRIRLHETVLIILEFRPTTSACVQRNTFGRSARPTTGVTLGLPRADTSLPNNQACDAL